MGSVAVEDPPIGYHANAIFERNGASLVALVLTICELIANAEHEARYIWRWPINQVKAIYIFTRYISIIGLSANAFVLFLGPLATATAPAAHCRAWFTALTVLACSVLFSIDAIAMLRVYALYNRNPKIGAFFASVLLTEATLVTTCSSRTVGKVPFSSICNVEKTPFNVLYFTGGVIFAQCSLLFFTLLKRKEMNGQRQVPMLKLVFRDGTWICTLVCCEFLILIPYSLITGTSKPSLVLVWPVALFSTASCRAILNMYHLRQPHDSTVAQATPSSTNTDIQFTSFFNLTDTQDSRILSFLEPEARVRRGSTFTDKTSDLACTLPSRDTADGLSALSLTISSAQSQLPVASHSQSGHPALAPLPRSECPLTSRPTLPFDRTRFS